jgi:hypothetical protein
MLTKFIEGLGGKLADSWATTLLTPAFVFWLGGAAAWAATHDYQRLIKWFTEATSLQQGAVLAVGLLVIAASAVIVQWFDLSVLRFLEGYWPGWLRPLKRILVKRRARQFKRASDRFQQLASKERAHLSADELEEFSRLDWQLMNTPAPNLLMPTKLGNHLRAAELRPASKYGLDAVICWPRLWLVLPDAAKAELTEARAAIDMAARLWLWGALFAIWCVWTWWAALVALATVFLAYRRLLNAAEVYGSLLESTYDMFRTSIYKSLRWKLPANPAEERQSGEELTSYIWRGSDQPTPTFVVEGSDPKEQKKS